MASPMYLKKQAFTLIELLIVVAIIAILAAIAVPNFLEAQVRSKVSRARSDLRSMATALESYAVDNNKYPPALGTCTLAPGYNQIQNLNNFYGTGRTGGWRGLPQQLSTPISYITSLPVDVFKIGLGALSPDTNIGSPYVDGNPFDATFVYHNIQQFTVTIPGSYDNGDIIDYGMWRIMSLGPDKIYNPIGTADPSKGWLYDPTNGTISSGNIIRTQNDTIGAHFTR